MNKLLFIMIFVLSGIFPGAQENQKIDQSVFPDVVIVEPNPPKPIKGWKMVEEEKSMSVLVGEYPSKIIKFQFRGDAVGIETIAIPDAGIIEFSIDASDWERLDLYAPIDTENQLPLFFTLGNNLKDRKHTLQIRLTEDKNLESTGTKCMIRHFYYNAPR
jgi:hypothetical protein